MRSRRLTPKQQAAAAWQSRGYYVTRRGYTSLPWDLHPDDIYTRVVPTGPFNIKWEGVQKERIESKQMTFNRASHYSMQPRYLQQTSPRWTPVTKNNFAGTLGMAGPTIYAEQQGMTPAANASGPVRLILNRIRNVSR